MKQIVYSLISEACITFFLTSHTYDIHSMKYSIPLFTWITFLCAMPQVICFFLWKGVAFAYLDISGQGNLEFPYHCKYKPWFVAFPCFVASPTICEFCRNFDQMCLAHFHLLQYLAYSVHRIGWEEIRKNACTSASYSYVTIEVEWIDIAERLKLTDEKLIFIHIPANARFHLSQKKENWK